jgi:hypothetical protein
MMQRVVFSGKVTRKIVALTSMTLEEITMTTSVKVDVASDLFVKNEVMNFNQDASGFTTPLAGASWVSAESSQRKFIACISNTVLELVERNLPEHVVWLFVGTSTWQPNTRVVRHYKLWGALKVRGFNLPSINKLAEQVTIESSIGLKFFGAVRLADFEIEDAVQILFGENCTYLVALPKNIEPHYLLKTGWSGDLTLDASFINFLALSNALLLKRVGYFDDCERDIVAIGQPSVVNTLLDV